MLSFACQVEDAGADAQLAAAGVAEDFERRVLSHVELEVLLHLMLVLVFHPNS